MLNCIIGTLTPFTCHSRSHFARLCHKIDDTHTNVTLFQFLFDG